MNNNTLPAHPSFNDDSNIDPTLLAMDPARRYREQLRNRSGSSTPAPEASSDDPPAFELPASVPQPASSLLTFARIAKHRLDLNDQEGAALERFCQLASTDERLVILFAESLKLKTAIKSIVKEEGYSVSKAADASIKQYVAAFLLGHTTAAFRGLKAAESILAAMREMNVAGLPNEKELDKIEIVLKAIRHRLTSVRNSLKSKIKDSLKPDAATRNIASLVNAIIAKMKNIDPTLQLYMKIAYLRFCVVNYGQQDDEAFWLKTDDVLTGMRHAAGTQADLTTVFNGIYDDDVRTYGDPAVTTHTTVHISTLPSWQMTLARHAAKVKPNLKPNLKRGFEEMDDNDNA